jgi:hypothetical protein
VGCKAVETCEKLGYSYTVKVKNLTVSLFPYTQLIILYSDVKENALLSETLTNKTSHFNQHKIMEILSGALKFIFVLFLL